ncbi:hypothetical protein D3C78_1968760 [compost metagenome]
MAMRFHGERYPLVANSGAGNRAKNRRVTVQLSRVEAPSETPATAAQAEPAVSAAAGGAPAAGTSKAASATGS